jgi:uncharacterized membrane protein YvbJ
MLNEVIIVMVYCVKCGVKNSDDAKFCVKCGENLTSSQEKWEWERRVDTWGEDVGKRAEKWGKQMEREFKDECFGLPHGGAIVGIIVGIIILVLGFALLANINIWSYLGPIGAIIVGILILTGVAYRLTRR